jgi:hypothetical protein
MGARVANGIIGEPYFDVDFSKMLYLTDTGRRWDGGIVSVRDKAQGSGRRAQGEESFADWRVKPMDERVGFSECKECGEVFSHENQRILINW